MGRKVSWTAVVYLMWAVASWGCRSPSDRLFHDPQAHYQAMITQIEYPDACVTHCEGLEKMPSPQTARSSGPVEHWPMTLEEAVRTALNNSQVMRELGGVLVSTPATAVTVYDPALRETDPRGGTEAALAAFDAQFNAGISWGTRDPFFSGFLPLPGGNEFGLVSAEISKIAATGTQYSISNRSFFARTNGLLNLNPRFGNNVLAGEVRQPLLQGAGIEFNRIAGPKSAPGAYNGVLIARTNTDISLADFEASVRDLVGNVERAYWDLYAAYRELDARVTGRDAALETWRSVDRKFRGGSIDLEQEARAREQYYAFDSQVINALSGRSSSGPMSQPTAAGGVYALERRLRWQLGLPASDGRLIRPREEPPTALVVFDWNESLRESLVRRVELRRQRWVIKRRELELIAAKNFTLMRLDAIGEYGWRAFDADLGTRIGPADDLFSGNTQEWQVGLQLSTPIGNHLGHTAVRNAQFQLARERAVYRDQELRITHELSDAITELDRSYAATRSLLNVRLAAQQQLSEIRKKYEAGWSPLEFLLDAQRRAVEADSAYYRSLVDYTLAVANMHRARGSLLEYHDVYLTEGPSSPEAHCSAAKESRRFQPKEMNYGFQVPPPFTQGVCPQYVSDAPRPSADESAPSSGSLPTPPENLPAPPPLSPIPRPRDEAPQVPRPPETPDAQGKDGQ